jgi:ComF family protein
MRSAVDASGGAVDLVVPVPLHGARERERGFNQAAALARAMDLPVCHALVRRVATPPQASLSGVARRSNLRGAFALARHAPAVAGRRVALVDDVLTTGATLSAAAEALGAAGPAEIVAVTAARAALARR